MKAARQRKIIELITQRPISTQERLTAELIEAGFEVSQATVSRDIKEMGLIKVMGRDGNYYYACPNPEAPNPIIRLKRLFADSVLKIDTSDNLVVIKTLPGVAHAVASCIDGIGWPEIIGTVAGDDTILAVIKNRKLAKQIHSRFSEFLTP
ncbi:MAG: arginine repressor [Clostridia bacterium]|nr:arginine repressor [Clostridia bacterium]